METLKAIKQKVIVQSGGRIEISAPELVAGSEVEVIVLFENGAWSTPSATKRASNVSNSTGEG